MDWPEKIFIGSFWLLVFVFICYRCGVWQYLVKKVRSYRQSPTLRHMNEAFDMEPHLPGTDATIPFGTDGDGDANMEVILAELRRNAAATTSRNNNNFAPTAGGSTKTIRQARQEYVENVLITKRVLIGDEPKLEPKQDIVVSLASQKEDSNNSSAQAAASAAQQDDVVDKKSTSISCAICLASYQPNEILCWSHNPRCLHHYHKACIQKWLTQSNRNDCPCCRHNYLALSDDEDSENGDEAMATIPGQDDLIPSVEDIETLERSNTETRLAELAAWQDDDEEEENLEQSLGYVENSSNEDDWSCPGESDTEDNGNDFYIARPWNLDMARRNRAANHPWRRRPRPGHQVQQQSTSTPQQMIDLDLGTLLAEECLQRAERGEDDDGSSQTGSVYTHHSQDEGVATNSSSSDSHSVAVSSPPRCTKKETPSSSIKQQREGVLCAICRSGYQVNEEICWSRDPLCNHVFHRQCLDRWIMEEDHAQCPLCCDQCDDITTASGRSFGNSIVSDLEDNVGIVEEGEHAEQHEEMQAAIVASLEI